MTRNKTAARRSAPKSTTKETAPASRKTATAKAASGKSATNTDSSAHSQTTTDHDEIRSWAEERGAHPACVKGTGDKNDIGLLRLDFPGYSEDKLQEISWEDFFEKFDERGLALVYQEETADGAVSNFNKLVSRTAEDKPRKGAAH